MYYRYIKTGISILGMLFFLALFPLKSQDPIAKGEEASKNKKNIFRDPDDGAIDISSFLLEHKGALPVTIIITEPAVGYGGGLGLLFFQKSKKKYDVPVPPNITGGMGLITQNKTWAAALFHFHVFGPDKVRYVGAVVKPDINIKYYGNNNDFLSQNPMQFNLNSWAVIQRVQVRVAQSDLFVGGAYTYFNAKSTIDTLPNRPVINKILENLNGKSTISSLQAIVNWDTRDNIFTPLTGLNTGVSLTYNATWLGGDDTFFKLNTYLLGFQPISRKIYSGWRFDGSFMLGDAPLYSLPFIQLRGVPAMKYQSNNTLLVETDWRFEVYRRWSLNVFTGTGKAFTGFSEISSADWVYNYGVGFRYKLAKALGMHAGIDFAGSNGSEFAFYLVFGSPWMK